MPGNASCVAVLSSWGIISYLSFNSWAYSKFVVLILVQSKETKEGLNVILNHVCEFKWWYFNQGSEIFPMRLVIPSKYFKITWDAFSFFWTCGRTGAVGVGRFWSSVLPPLWPGSPSQKKSQFGEHE
jgi:hypothetical protein